VGEVDPVALEDVLHLQLEQVGIGERLAATAVAPVLGITSTAPSILCLICSRVSVMGFSVTAGGSASHRTNT
jgi:hypothetical protein